MCLSSQDDNNKYKEKKEHFKGLEKRVLEKEGSCDFSQEFHKQTHCLIMLGLLLQTSYRCSKY
jgi:hypothetical protein